MIDREQAIELVAQAMVDAYSSNDCPRAPDIEEATKIVDGLLALTDSLVSDLEHRLRVLAEAAVEDEQEIEHQREAMRALIDALEQDTIPGRIGVPYARVKAILADGNRIPPITSVVQRTIEKRDGPQGGKSVKVTDEPVPITDEMVRRAADAMPHHEEPSFWWSDSISREVLRRVLDAAINKR